MSTNNRYIQLHILTPYAPANLNRDDTGRPKTAVMGGVERLRISSQALKRAWRTSEAFQTTLAGHLGERTKRLGREIHSHIQEKNQVSDEKAKEITQDIIEIFGKPKGKETDDFRDIEQLAFIGPEEKEAALSLADKMAAGENVDLKAEAANVLKETDTAVDIAMFGRMFADHPEKNREAAVQVAHAVTTHKVEVEDDYYTAIDDLKDSTEDAGAGFLGVQEFGSGLFYLYICINRELLENNLAGNTELSNLAIQSLVKAIATISPKGKQNSYASYARAQFILAEKSSYQPRSLAAAFFEPVRESGNINRSIERLTKFRSKLKEAYNEGEIDTIIMDVDKPEKTLQDVLSFVTTE